MSNITPTDLIPAPVSSALSTPLLDSIGGEMRKTQALAKQHAQLAIAFAVRYGHLCEQAKAALPYGKFDAWLDEQGLNRMTAHRYRRLATCNAMLQLPAAELTAPTFLERIESDKKYRAELAAKVKEIAGERTGTEMLRDLQVLRGAENIDSETGKRKHYPAKKLSADEAAREVRKAALAAIQDALGGVEGILIRDKAYRHLTPGELLRADEHLTEVARKFHAITLRLTAEAKIAKKGGRG